MKGAAVYHRIKSLSEGHSMRECARRLGISINTVRKYAGMDLAEASDYLGKVKRSSQYDVARDFILDHLEQFPEMTATKLLRKVKAAQYVASSGNVNRDSRVASGRRRPFLRKSRTTPPRSATRTAAARRASARWPRSGTSSRRVTCRTRCDPTIWSPSRSRRPWGSAPSPRS